MNALFNDFKSIAELEHAMDNILQSPNETGSVELIVCRPDVNKRETLTSAELTIEKGLLGDNWKANENKFSYYNNYQDAQLAIINSRVMSAIAEDKQQWPLAGDQFYVDFDLSANNIAPGTRLSLGNAIIEVTAEPHLPCSKFAKRFGKDAAAFVKSTNRPQLNLRGIYAKVISPGSVGLNSQIRKITASS